MVIKIKNVDPLILVSQREIKIKVILKVFIIIKIRRVIIIIV